MENFDDNGIFWLPDAPESTYGGHLTYSPEGGCSLVLLEPTDANGTQLTDSVKRILGVIRNKQVTLLECTSSSYSNYTSTRYQKYRAQHLLVGQSFVPDDEPSFTTVSVDYRNLAHWVDRTGFVQSDRNRIDELMIRYVSPGSPSSDFSRGRIWVESHWEFHMEYLREQRITEFPRVRIAYSKPTTLGDVLGDIGSMQDLISLCADEFSPVESIRLQRPDLPQRSLDGSIFPDTQDPLDYYNQPVESPSRAKPVHKYEMLVGLADVGGIGTVAAWLNNASDFRYVLGLLMTARMNGNTYIENRYLNICGAGEAFHRLTQGGFQIPPNRFERLRSLAIESMPNGKDRAWIKGRLRYNEPTLAQRLEALADYVSPALQGLVTDVRTWATTVAEVRNRLVHQDRPGIHGFDGGSLYWLAESVFSLTRASMLRYVGADTSVMHHIAASNRTTWYAPKLQDAITDLRNVLANRS